MSPLAQLRTAQQNKLVSSRLLSLSHTHILTLANLHSRGLEDHYAEMVGKTNSYYIRKRHEDLILREVHRLRYANNCVEKLAAISEQSAEDERERAVEMAKMDECMAKEEGQEGATTSPVGAPLFTSGEAFLHTLMVRLRDYS